uniref:Uncharacterized protein n=1 Tax=Globodera rostochiensis TaxID=31243 RepID=A0A914I7S1_GLORO
MLGMLPTSATIVGMMLLLLMVHKPHCAADDDPVEIMREFTVEYNILSGPAYDVLEHLSVISEKAKFFMKLSGPVGSIIAACVETAFPNVHVPMRQLQYLFNLLTDPNEDRKIWKANLCPRATRTPNRRYSYYSISTKKWFRTARDITLPS